MRDCLRNAVLVIRNNLSNVNNVSVACRLILDSLMPCFFPPSRRPFVLDPANPTNNVCSASNAEGWKIVADVAKMTLRRQPLKHVFFNKNWKIKQV